MAQDGASVSYWHMCNTPKHSGMYDIMIWCDIWYDMWHEIWYDKRYDMTWHDMMMWCDVIWYDMIWYDIRLHNENEDKNVRITKDDLTIRRKLHETAAEFIYIWWKPTRKSITWSDFIPRAWLFNLKTCVSAVNQWTHITRIIHMILSLYIWHITHYTKSSFTLASLPLYYHFLTGLHLLHLLEGCSRS